MIKIVVRGRRQLPDEKVNIDSQWVLANTDVLYYSLPHKCRLPPGCHVVEVVSAEKLALGTTVRVFPDCSCVPQYGKECRGRQ